MTDTTPKIEGPVAGVPLLGGLPTESPHPAYTQEEFFVSGVATSYVAAGDLGSDGRWDVEPAAHAPYTTRVLVRRPSDPGRHNGTVVVEWLNVSGGHDAAPQWGLTHRHLTRAGYAWVGVSAQRVGVEGGGLVPGMALKLTDPQRYAALEHPGDEFSFDIFHQAGVVVRAAAGGMLGPLHAARVLAVGESQSAAFLVTYVNAIDPIAPVFDGFLVHSRSGGVAGLAGIPAPSGPDAFETIRRSFVEGTVRVRDDVRVPVLTLQSETDVVAMGSLNARQPDHDRFRLWEIAGSSHAETYLLVASRSHTDRTTVDELAAACGPTTTPLGPLMPCERPINSGPQQHYVAQAAIEGLDTWVRDGAAPPEAPRLEVVPGPPPRLALDEHGIARGGVRTGWVDAPAAVLSGLGQEGAVFAFLFGTTVALDDATLGSLYPGGVSDYVERFSAATRAAVEAGFLLAEDVPEMVALAEAMFPRVAAAS